MSETETAPPPAPSTGVPPVPPRPLHRDDDRVLAGVCAAVGRWTGTDPVLWRVVLGVLAFFGGAGIALYLAGWLLIPRQGGTPLADRLLAPGRMGPANAAVLALLVVLVAVVVGDGRGVAAVLVLLLVGYLVVRERAVAPMPGGPPGPDAPETPLPPTWGTAAPARPAPLPREPSVLGAATVASTALLGGLLLALRMAGVEALSASRILAACLAVVGVGLVVGTVVGRARWLFFFPGMLLVGALAATAAVGDVVGGGAGERTWSLVGGGPRQSFELGLGEATLDLRGADTSGDVLEVSARVGAGHLLVLVPDDLTVRVSARVGLGEIDDGGPEAVGGPGVRKDFVVGDGDVEAELDLQVGTGQVEVRRG